MFLNRPDICAHIRKLAVRPNYYLSWPKADDPLDEGWVVMMIEKIAGNLKGLHTFDWDGLEMPKDHLWSTLQRWSVRMLSGLAGRQADAFVLSCPQLKTVFSNVGSRPLDPNSHVCYRRLNCNVSR